jgi:transcriptional regulator with XRE-family HTH domain
MTGKEIMSHDAERAAVEELRAATYGAARLIRTAFIRAGKPAKSKLEVPGTLREYGIRQTPLLASRVGLTVTRQAPIWRLLMHDADRSRTWGHAPFTVLEPTKFRSQDKNLGARLRDGGGPGGRNLFSGALGTDHIRFWLDVEGGLRKQLDHLLTSEERSHLDKLCNRAKRAVPAWVAARRETLGLTQRKLADLTNIPVDEIVRIETEKDVLNAMALTVIEKAFMRRADEIELTGRGDPSEPDEPDVIVSDDAMQKWLHAAGIPLNGFKTGPVRSKGEMPVRAAAAKGGKLPPLPKITSGADVRDWRGRLGVNLKVLGIAAGMSESAISNVETGKKEISPDIQLRLGIAVENLAATMHRSLA